MTNAVTQTLVNCGIKDALPVLSGSKAVRSAQLLCSFCEESRFDGFELASERTADGAIVLRVTLAEKVINRR